MDFREKRKIKNIIYSKLSIFILLVLIFVVARGVFRAYEDAMLTKENKEIATEQLQELQEREKEISGEISSLETPEGKEREIRNKFRVAKEGEQMIMIINEKNNGNFKMKDKTFWEKTKEFFGF